MMERLRKDGLVPLSNSVEALEGLQPELANAALFHAARVAALGGIATNRALREIGLKVRSFSVLSLACAPAATTQKRIAEYLLLDPSQVVALLDELESRDLVQRIPDPGDRRARQIVATPAGIELHHKATELAAEAEAKLLDSLDLDERQTLISLLSRIEQTDGGSR